MLRCHIIPLVGDGSLATFSVSDYQELLRSLARRPRTVRGKKAKEPPERLGDALGAVHGKAQRERPK